MVATMWRKFEKGDGEFFKAIADSFDQEGGIVHGLHHFKDPNELCDCPACARFPLTASPNRRSPLCAA